MPTWLHFRIWHVRCHILAPSVPHLAHCCTYSPFLSSWRNWGSVSLLARSHRAPDTLPSNAVITGLSPPVCQLLLSNRTRGRGGRLRWVIWTIYPIYFWFLPQQSSKDFFRITVKRSTGQDLLDFWYNILFYILRL